MHRLLLSFLLPLLLALALPACESEPARARCPQCGMFTDAAPRWLVGLTGPDGTEHTFDSPKCMVRWMRSDDGRGSSLAWVTEYYSQERRPVVNIRFVLGSDVESPMGRDLVPITGQEAATRFSGDHGGMAVVTLGDITDEMLAGLDPQ